MIIYTLQNQPPLPSAIGHWARLERCDDMARPTWRLTFENAVGGSVAYRFATKAAAMAYNNRLCVLREVAA